MNIINSDIAAYCYIKNMSYRRLQDLYGSHVPFEKVDQVNEELFNIKKQNRQRAYAFTISMMKKLMDKGIIFASRGALNSSYIAWLCRMTLIDPFTLDIPPVLRYYDLEKTHISEYCFDIPKKAIKDIVPVCKEIFRENGFRNINSLIVDNSTGKSTAVHLSIVFNSSMEHEREIYFCQYRKDDKGKHTNILFLDGQNQQNYGISNSFELEQYYNTTLIGFSIMFISSNEIDGINKYRFSGESINPGIGIFDLPDIDTLFQTFIKNQDLIKATYKWTHKSDSSDILPFEYRIKFSKILKMVEPSSLDQLFKVIALTFSEGAWENNGKDLFVCQGVSITDIISNKEDVFRTLKKHGFNDDEAYMQMNKIRKGNKIDCVSQMKLREAGVPEWFIESTNKIQYLPGLAEIKNIAYIIMLLVWLSKSERLT